MAGIIIEKLTAEELAAQQKELTLNQQVYQALEGMKVGEGFAMPVPKDDRSKIITAFKPFMANKAVKGTLSAHKTDKEKVIVERTV